MFNILKLWYRQLNLRQKTLVQHQKNLTEEHEEFRQAKGLLHKWSEMSDIYFCYKRAKYSGFDLDYPLSTATKPVAILYMLPKITLRALFFYRAGKELGSNQKTVEVRNPKKIRKLHMVADKYGLDRKQFQAVCEKKLKYWILLP